MNKLKSAFRKSKGVDDYLPDLEGLFDAPKVPLLEKFKMPEMDKFDGTWNPKSHLRLCATLLHSLGLRSEHRASLFLRILTGSALDWQLLIEPTVAKDWESLAQAFVAQYICNQSFNIVVMDLEMTCQDPKKTLAEYMARWRAKA